jgi:hypothetical protein
VHWSTLRNLIDGLGMDVSALAGFMNALARL